MGRKSQEIKNVSRKPFRVIREIFSVTKIKKGRTVSRVLSCTVICLARPLPDGSSGLPGARRAAVSLRFNLAPGGACICPFCYQKGGSLLHCHCTLTALMRRYHFCCAFLRVTPTGRYPAPCPVKPGLSSSGTSRRRPRPYILPAPVSYQIRILPSIAHLYLTVMTDESRGITGDNTRRR